MKKTAQRPCSARVALTLEEVAARYGCGLATADRLGTEAGAKFKVGRRSFYLADRINRYVEAQANVR